MNTDGWVSVVEQYILVDFFFHDTSTKNNGKAIHE